MYGCSGDKVVFFHVNNVHSGRDHTIKTGDEVTFIYDEYDKGAIDVQFLPTLSDFHTTSETAAQDSGIAQFQWDRSKSPS